MSHLMVLWGWRVESKHGQESPPTRPESPVHLLGATQSRRSSSHWVRTRPDFHFYINRIGLTAVRRTQWGGTRGGGASNLPPQGKPVPPHDLPAAPWASPALASILLFNYPLEKAGLRISIVSLPVVPFPVPMSMH